MLISAPVFSGTYENALAKNKNVFLYLYTPECSVCKNFESIYTNLSKSNKDFAFVKVNANTAYGYNLLKKYRGHYVPYIILTNSKTNKSVNITHSCVMDEMCMSRALKSFKG